MTDFLTHIFYLLVGAVTAGVIGTKTYSYHLFGDAVNTGFYGRIEQY